MAVNNILKSTELLTPTVVSVTSEKVRHPVANTLIRKRAKKTWHSTSTAQQDIVLLMPSVPNGLYIGETNFNTILLHESSDNITFYETGPNLLRQSHAIDQSPWSNVGTPTVTASYGAGPSPESPLGVRIQGNVTTGRQQSITNNISGIVYTAGVYVRSLQGSTNIQLRLNVGATATRNFTISSDWELVTITTTGVSGTALLLDILSNQVSGDFLVGGAFIKKGAGIPYTVFQTNATGLMITSDAWVNRYKLGIDISGFTGLYLRVRVPSQTPVDGASVFKCGRIIPYNFIEFSDFPQKPPTFEPKIATDIQTFPDDSTTISKLGDVYMTLSFSGLYRSSTNLSTLRKFATDDPGTLYIIHDNFWNPDGKKSIVNPNRCYVMELVEKGEYGYDLLPELVTFTFKLQEVI